METYMIFRDLAIIILAAKVCGVLARKCKVPQVVGEIVAGLLIGPSVFGIVAQSDFLAEMAEIGVILLMFSAGLETNIKDLLKTGPIAFLIACAGVFVPLVAGTMLYMGFYGVVPWGSEKFFSAVFIGTIMTATSVSITVETLKELGKLKGKIGTTILGAAIIDDVLGILVLTFVIGFKNPESRPSEVLLNTIGFFVFVVIVGYAFYKIFQWMDKRYPHTRRLPIAGLALCLGLAYIAEKYFGIADITGAYVAGVILCSLKDSSYIAGKIDVNSYMLFGPIFFASIGLKTNLESVGMQGLLFAACFVATALLAKVIGCGLMARLCRFQRLDSLKIGLGMMARGEVALVVAQKGLSAGLISSSFFTAVILMIVVSSIVTPIFLKLAFNR